METQPSTDTKQPNTLVLTPEVRGDNGRRWIHKDYVQVQAAYADETHPYPPTTTERFGTVNSFARYLAAYKTPAAFIRWNKTGIFATLDYVSHERPTGEVDDDRFYAGRGKWVAEYPFILTKRFQEWTKFANGQGVSQEAAIDFLEDHLDDIKAPDSAALLTLLRTLRTTVNSSAATEYRPDGGTKINFTSEATIKSSKGSAEVDLPPEITVALPVLDGHVDVRGNPVVYAFKVKVRASVGDHAALRLRFGLQNVDRVLDEVYRERVDEARTYFKENAAELEIYRAAD